MGNELVKCVYNLTEFFLKEKPTKINFSITNLNKLFNICTPKRNLNKLKFIKTFIGIYIYIYIANTLNKKDILI